MIIFKLGYRNRILFVVFLIVLLGLFYSIWVWHQPLVNASTAHSFKVHPGDTQEKIHQRLKQQQFTSHASWLNFLSHILGYHYALHYGEYQITPGMNYHDLMVNIDQKRMQVKHKITFIEGLTFSEFIDVLSKNNNIRHLLKGKTEQQILKALGVSHRHAEGLFFPDTYQFVWGNSDIDILSQAYNEMARHLGYQWKNRQPGLAYKTPYEALIVASLIESETPVIEERPVISGVILQRLKIGMKLQLDPTVMYGLGMSRGASLLRSQLNKDTPYNTYLHYGLPPTPIGMPSESSLAAALHPEFKGYLYYVASGKGGHVFSKNFAGHKTAVTQYRALQKKEERISKQREQQWLVVFPKLTYMFLKPMYELE